MRYCTGCGARLADEDRFCPSCGHERRSADASAGAIADAAPASLPVRVEARPIPVPAEAICVGCRFRGTRTRSARGELGPLKPHPGGLWHEHCWQAHRHAQLASPAAGVPSGGPGQPTVVVESRAMRVSCLWMVFIVVVLAVLLVVCFSTSFTIGPAG